MSDTAAHTLRVSYVWDSTVMNDIVLREQAPVTLGTTGRSTFTTADVGLPEQFAILRPGARGYVLTLGAQMGGTVSLDGKQVKVATFVKSGGERADGASGSFRATPVAPGDWGVIDIDPGGAHKVCFHFTPPERPLPPPPPANPEHLVPAIAFAVVLHAMFLTFALVHEVDGNKLMFPGRMEVMTAYLVEPPRPRAPAPETAGETQAPEQKVTPATRRQAGAAGGQGKRRAQTPAAPSPQPKAFKGTLIDKENREVYTALTETSSMRDIQSAIDSLKGESRITGGVGAGRGSGGGVGDARGTGTRHGGNTGGRGGGGAHGGDIESSGKIDAGETRGRRGTGGRALREVAVELKTGDASGDLGGLTREEVARVIRSKQGLIRTCYQKQLNRSPGLSGTLLINFRILGNGSVSSARVVRAKSSLGNRDVEDCVTSRIQRLTFPAKGDTASITFPFIFSQS